MRSPADFRAWAAKRWRAHWPTWLAASASGSEEAGARDRGWPLHPPTEAVMAADPDAVAAWVRDWQTFAAASGVHVEWVTRAWRGYGTQRLPDRASASPGTLAVLAGEAATWQRALDAATRLRDVWPDADLTDAVRGGARRLGALDEADVVRLLAVVAWLAANPDSGLWEREVPVVGVHTKWVERHRALVELLVAAVTGLGTGLARTPVRFRVRVLDAALAGGPTDFAVGLDELRRWEVRPGRVLVCENATTIGTLPPLSDTVAVHGMGFAAPVLAEVPWISAACVQYWGDLDTYGFQILGQVREVLPEVTSVLMDAATWLEHETLAVPEPRPFRGIIGYLTAGELETLALVRTGDRRLEQERIPRAAATAALQRSERR